MYSTFGYIMLFVFPSCHGTQHTAISFLGTGPPIVLNVRLQEAFRIMATGPDNQVQEHCPGSFGIGILKRLLHCHGSTEYIYSLVSRRYPQAPELDTPGQKPRPVAREGSGTMHGSECTELNPLKIIHH